MHVKIPLSILLTMLLFVPPATAHAVDTTEQDLRDRIHEAFGLDPLQPQPESGFCKPGAGCLPVYVDEDGDTMTGVLQMLNTDIDVTGLGKIRFQPDPGVVPPTPLETGDGFIPGQEVSFISRELAELHMPISVQHLLAIEDGASLELRGDSALFLSEGEGEVGTIDQNAFNLIVNNETAFRIQPGAVLGIPNIIGGHNSNVVPNGTEGAFIAGGGGDGMNNNASADFASVLGGARNAVTGQYGTTAGGLRNHAGGLASLAAGQDAAALHNNTFVWADGLNEAFSSTGVDQFLIRADGGVGIGTNAPVSALTVNGDITPAVDDIYDIGSPTHRYATLYLASVIDHATPLVFESGGVTTASLSTDGALSLAGDVTAFAFAGDGSGLGEVTAVAVEPGSIVTESLADNAVTADKILDGSVITAKLDLSAVTTDKIADGAVTSAKIADGTIGAADVDSSAIQLRIGSGCAAGNYITSIAADGTVSCAADQDTQIFAGQGLELIGSELGIANLGVGTGLIADGAVTTNKMTIDGSLIPNANDAYALGADANRYSDLYLGSAIDYATDLEFVSGGAQQAVLTTAGQLGVGKTPTEAVDVAGSVKADSVKIGTSELTTAAGDLFLDGTEVCVVGGGCSGGLGDTLGGSEIVNYLDVDTDKPLTHIPSQRLCYLDVDGDLVFDVDEPVYVRFGPSCTTVSVGDLRLTPNGPHAVHTRVAAPDSDLGNALTEGAGSSLGFADGNVGSFDANGDGRFYTGDALYLDTDKSGAVSVGDVRLIAHAGKAAGTVVGAADSDMGNPLAGEISWYSAFRFWNLNSGASLDSFEKTYYDLDAGSTVSGGDIRFESAADLF